MPTAIIVRPDPGSKATRMVRDHVFQRRKLRLASITRAMEEAGHTITSLSRATGVDRSYISRIINGSRTPGLDATYRLARALKVDMEWMTRTLLPDLDVIDSILRKEDTHDPRLKPNPRKHQSASSNFAVHTGHSKPVHGR